MFIWRSKGRMPYIGFELSIERILKRMTTKILVADDNPKMRKVLRLALGEHPDWVICGEASDGLEAVSKAAELMPDIVILDLTMPKLNGIAAGSTIHLAAPEMPLLLFTQHRIDPTLEQEARKAGFTGGVSKGLLHQLIAGIESLLRGETYFPDSVIAGPPVSDPQPAETIPQVIMDEARDEAS